MNPRKPDPKTAFWLHAQAALDDGSFVKCSLSRPANDASAVERVTARLIEIQGKPRLSCSLREARRDVTRNFPPSEGVAWLKEQLATEFRSAVLATTKRDWQLTIEADGSARLIGHKPAKQSAPARDHDQPRHELLDASARDWLHGLDVTDAAGNVHASMADKHRQVNRYLELFSHLLRETPAPAGREWVIADMGCGKGYLTFGAWQLFQRQLKLPVRMLGVEARADLVTKTNELARRIGATNLEFTAGSIATAALPPLDMLIALHACDTATDDAIRRGIDLGARLIVLSPCCQKELRPQLKAPAVLAPIMAHGIMSERMAEWLTDGLRSMFLEWAGYRTKVFEFVSLEHTSRNVMIAAIREREPFTSSEARDRIIELKKFFGIGHHALDALLQSNPAAK